MKPPPQSRYVGSVRIETGAGRPVYASTEPHVCNPYCRAGRHADLLYRADPDILTLAVAQMVADLVSPGRRVLEVRPAPEAPLPSGFRAAWLITYGPLSEARR